jgi:SAM-dependent methyltransferase
MWALLNIAETRKLTLELNQQLQRDQTNALERHAELRSETAGARRSIVALGEELRSEIDELRSEISESRDTMGGQRVDIDTLRDDFAPLFDRVRGLREQANNLADKGVVLQEGLATVQGALSAVRREVLFQQRRLTVLADGLPAQEIAPQRAAEVADQRLDSLYIALEDALRGGHDDIKQRLNPYVEHVKLAGGGDPKHPILDIGCGRGEWLELLKDNHISAYGIDSNTMMVERTKALGLDARHFDLLQHLKMLPEASLSAITAFHVVEHLPFGVLVDFLDEALRVLVPGGLFILETPNPETMRVGATTFYNDPTHRNPIPPMLLHFLVGNRGFTQIEVIRLHPFDYSNKLHEETRDAKHLNAVLFGAQDYAVVARRDIG